MVELPKHVVSLRSFQEVWTASAAFGEILPAGNRDSEAPYGLFSIHIQDYLKGDPRRAEQMARRMLESRPLDPPARFLLGASLRRQQRYDAARDALADLCSSHSQIGSAWRELGLTLRNLGAREEAIAAFVRAIDAGPADALAWRELGALLFEDSENETCGEARMSEACRAYRDARHADAESILIPLLQAQPENVRALKLLGDIQLALNRRDDAETIFVRCVALAPDYVAARFRFAATLLAGGKPHAVAETEALRKREPGNVLYRQMQAIALAAAHQFEPAIALYDGLISQFPERDGLWYQRARLVRFVRPDDAAGFFEEMLLRFPRRADLYYHIATIKSFHFDAAWPARILAALERPDLAAEQRVQLHYAAGKAFEDLKDYAQSFEHYKKSNDILAATWRPDGAEQTNLKWNTKAVFTRGLFRARAGAGCQEPGAIFIVGLPRAGSTLVDQILSSHSLIRSLGELADIPAIVDRELERDENGHRGAYPCNVTALDAARLRSLGEAYMARARGRLGAKSTRFFIDKAPNNFLHVGLIQLILPNAKIIDVRRHPLDCCFSCYKHYFPAGQPLTWDLRTVGGAYIDYVELMAHFDHVLPARVHRVIYEKLVENPVEEIRQLLDYVGVPFEEQCVRFHETTRVVHTISAEQVRQPLYKDGVGRWKNYEPWLAPLKEALGCLPELYPDVPEFFPRLCAQYSPYKPGANSASGAVTALERRPFENNSQPDR